MYKPDVPTLINKVIKFTSFRFQTLQKVLDEVFQNWLRISEKKDENKKDGRESSVLVFSEKVSSVFETI